MCGSVLLKKEIKRSLSRRNKVLKLDRILRPQSIAVIGGIHATRVVEQCQKMEFQGKIWPVHPEKKEVSGLPAYADISQLPGVPDVAFVGVNRHLTVSVVKSLREINAGGAVCYAAGFQEVGGDGPELQERLIKAAGDMPIIGPNCYGLINYAHGAPLWPDQHGSKRLREGQNGVAIITQSSNIAINFSMQQRGLPLAFLGTVGNQAKVGLSDMALAVLDDPRVTALGLHIEGFDSPQAMEALAIKAKKLGKPIVVFKVGKSDYAQSATLSHTASLSGSYATSTAFLARNGFGQAYTIGEFLECLKLLHCGGPLSGYRLSSMSCSGGEASIIADTCVGKRVNFPALTEPQKESLQTALGPMVTVSNPLDYNTYCWGKSDEMFNIYGTMAGCGFDMNLLVLDFPNAERCDDSEWLQAVRVFRSALESRSSRGALVVSMAENISSEYADWYIEKGLIPLIGFDNSLRACEIAADIQRYWEQEDSEPILQLPAVGGEGLALDEAVAKKKLIEYGISIPDGAIIDSVERALEKADEMGYPVVLKALGIAHKTERNAVRLNLENAETVNAAADALFLISDSLYIEKMVSSSILELIIGVTRDAQMGLQMTIGSGGVLVEILRDTATLLIPATRASVENALLNLQLAPLFHGYRGKARADVGAAIDAIMKIQEFAQSEADRLLELDINPLILCKENHGAFAADALMVIEDRK